MDAQSPDLAQQKKQLESAAATFSPDDDTAVVDISTNSAAGTSGEIIELRSTADLPQIKTKKKRKLWRRKKTSESEVSKTPATSAKSVPYFSLFRFATPFEKLMIVIASICAVGHGVLSPMSAIVFGNLIDSFQGDPTTVDYTDVLNDVKNSALWFLYLALIAAVTSYVQVTFFSLTAQRQAMRIRRLYFQALMRHEQGWYDNIDSGELTSRVAGDVIKVEGGMSDKLGSFLQYSGMCICGFAVGFGYSWKLTLVVIAVSPAMAASGAMVAKLSASAASEEQQAYGKAGAVAEEVFSLIRTVTAFGGKPRETKRYERELEGAYAAGVKKAVMAGLGMGITMGLVWLIYALSFWYGNQLVIHGELTPGRVLTVYFSIIIGAMAIGQAAPSVTAFADATGAAYHIFEVIERTSTIDNLSPEGYVDKEGLKGDLELKDVKFAYPVRPDRPVLNGVSLSVKCGSMLALVGASGHGKSTIVQLLERFYDPTSGQVILDGRDMRDYNVLWLRSQLGIVSQMPTLFAMTIAENIALGAGLVENEEYNSALPSDGWTNRRFVPAKVTHEDIIAAAQIANAHNFIMQLPQGYDTVIGERGAQLSGGQKQRIAIARALVKNPTILLLDEATSALDSESERMVQEALENAQKGRTTVVIAHRLSTVMHADVIAVVEEGRIVETGNHSSLMAKEDGRYRRYVEMQQLSTGDGDSSAKTNIVQEKMASIKSHGHEDSSSDESDVEGINDDAEKVKKEKKKKDWGVITRAFVLNGPEKWYIIVGVISAAVAAGIWPFFAVIFSEITAVMVTQDNSMVRFWVLMFVLLAVIATISNFFHRFCLGLAGERLTRRVRLLCFSAILRQSIGWFDDREHSVGSLTVRLANEASELKGVTGDSLGVFVQQLTTLLTGIIIALVSCWRLALVVLACVPVLGMGAAMQMKLMSGFAADGNKYLIRSEEKEGVFLMFANAGRVASEAVDNMRTLSGLSAQYVFMDKYWHELRIPAQRGMRKANIAGLSFGFTEFCMFGIWGLSFWYGSQLVADGDCDFAGMMKAISAIIFGAMTVGQVSALGPNTAEANAAGKKVFELLDTAPKEDPADAIYCPTAPESIRGDVAFKNITFEYPTRPGVTVLKGLSVQIEAGKTLALVGPSGGGKSTIIGQILRFYEPMSGEIDVDNMNIKQYPCEWLRAQMGIVSQEPDLFSMTIKDNIAYGIPDGQVVTDSQIEEAARLANAHDFIMALPEGYDAHVGERGSRLSGGQRQRVAIARALIRQPDILLLDEATSALDTESERIVQNALDAASKGRTTIVIAHRLSTISNADCIAVLANGKVAEYGTHSELIARGGLYARMVTEANRTDV